MQVEMRLIGRIFLHVFEWAFGRASWGYMNRMRSFYVLNSLNDKPRIKRGQSNEHIKEALSTLLRSD